MRIQTSLLHALVLILAYSLNAAPISELIVVDQLGYRPASDKWFMIAVPVTGQNAGQGRPPASEVQIRRTSDLAVVQSISLQRWSNGAVHSSSGDRVWQGEFSNLRIPGTYHVFDPANNVQSFDFDIREDAYNSILTASTKSYYYQRSGTAITPEYGEQWTHGPAHIANQLASRMFDNSLGGIQPESTALDITGGWYDAGDYRKYTSWMAEIIWDLGTAYEWWPSVFGDQSGIPESGNGIPDLLDEARNEVDFWLALRDGEGYSHGVTNPDGDGTMYQADATSCAAWASAANAAMLASCLALAGLDELADSYTASALEAWRVGSLYPADELDRFQHTGINGMLFRDFRMTAASFLWDLTGQEDFERIVRETALISAGIEEVQVKGRDQIWATAGYLFSRRRPGDGAFASRLRAVAIAAGRSQAAAVADDPSRRSSDPMLLYFHTGQNVDRIIVAHALLAADPSAADPSAAGPELVAGPGLQAELLDGQAVNQWLRHRLDGELVVDVAECVEVAFGAHDGGGPQVGVDVGQRRNVRGILPVRDLAAVLGEGVERFPERGSDVNVVHSVHFTDVVTVSRTWVRGARCGGGRSWR